MKPIIQVENLSKLYAFDGSHHFSLKEVADHWWNKIIGKKIPSLKSSDHYHEFDESQRGPKPNTFWALKDVNFEVKEGEVLGVIGRNGAGKSTLLKILSRITEPTSGQAILRGRVASLLEVGTGFHPDLTGRENIYLNGAILGMRRWEINRKFKHIVEFAEIEKFIDTPVKHYSSGMYVRLAFAVAAHLEPEILFIDEILAVGDSAFQNKCLGKMGEIAKLGRTVLFISHNMSVIARLCTQTGLLVQGQLTKIGKTEDVVSAYLASSSKRQFQYCWSLEEAPGDHYLKITKVEILNKNGELVLNLHQNVDFIIKIEYQVLKSMMSANVGFALKTNEGTIVFSSYDSDNPEWGRQGRHEGRYIAECIVPGNLLNEGLYYLTIEAGIPNLQLCLRVEDVISLPVEGPISDGGPVGRNDIKRKGIILPDLKWNLKKADTLK